MLSALGSLKFNRDLFSFTAETWPGGGQDPPPPSHHCVPPPWFPSSLFLSEGVEGGGRPLVAGNSHVPYAVSDLHPWHGAAEEAFRV